MIGHGFVAFLATVVEVPTAVPGYEDIPLDHEFPDIFPSELTLMSPDREIEFVIDVVPGTAPISKAPYRMAPAKIRKLKVHLLDLMDKGFIGPRLTCGLVTTNGG